ncbi:MAG: hypothetical protein ABL949_10290 [Fimbriimonadaceae bacterium]
MASLISVMVAGGAVASLIMGSSSWIKGSASLDADTSAERAVRRISAELREAMAVTVDGGGQGLTYRLPTKDGSGNFTSPITWDGVTRRIELSGEQIQIISGASTRVLIKNVTTTDPSTNTAYQLFTPGAGVVARAITIKVATSHVALKRQSNNQTRKSRYRETIYLRNIPELTSH